MLRESAVTTDRTVDLRAIVDTTVDPLLEAGAQLVSLVDAAIDRDDRRLATAREMLAEQVGIAGVVDAAAVFGNFEMMNRIADATGMPVGRGSLAANVDLIDELDLGRFQHD